MLFLLATFRRQNCPNVFGLTDAVALLIFGCCETCYNYHSSVPSPVGTLSCGTRSRSRRLSCNRCLTARGCHLADFPGWKIADFQRLKTGLVVVAVDVAGDGL